MTVPPGDSLSSSSEPPTNEPASREASGADCPIQKTVVPHFAAPPPPASPPDTPAGSGPAPGPPDNPTPAEGAAKSEDVGPPAEDESGAEVESGEAQTDRRGSSGDPETPGIAADGISGEEIEKLVQGSESAASGSGEPAKGVRQGRVMRVVGEDVFVLLDGGGQGTIPIEEFAGVGPPEIGAELPVVIQRYDPGGGIMVLSTRKAGEALVWQRIKRGVVVDGHVTAMNKGGLEVDIGGLRAFMPASQCDLRRMKDISILLSQDIRCEVMQVNRSKNEVVVSRRNALVREREQRRRDAVARLTAGAIQRGVVKNITDYGAFVDLGEVRALLHISDISWGRIQKPTDVVHIGQEIDVKILKVDAANGKVSVGLKQLMPNPWRELEKKYPVGSRVQGKVTRLADFGAFVEVEPGVEALVPLSEMSWSRSVRRPSDLLAEGQEIEALVLSADKSKRRLSLGLKQLTPNPWEGAKDRYAKESKVKGRVTRLADFGAFVELEPGLEGLVHISEMADRRIQSPKDVVEEGKEVEVRILGVDPEKQRISLSMRSPSPERKGAPEPDKAKKRKKELRGGLASHWDWSAGWRLNMRL
jgi:small subunit ribosomal protein S1